MSLDHPIEALAWAMASACYRDFDNYVYESRDFSQADRNARVTKTRRPSPHDVHVQAMFPQTWGSTALGFGGLGGQAVTTAYTIVLSNSLDGELAVYFGGRFAYKVKKTTEKFYADIVAQQLLPVARAYEYQQ